MLAALRTSQPGYRLLRTDFENCVERTWPSATWGQTQILVAVSGGADSVAMLRALLNISPEPKLLAVAHFNHGWRGKESDADEAFVAQLCDKLGLSLHVGRLCVDSSCAADSICADQAEQTGSSSPSKPGSEASARESRYAFLERTAYSIGARYVCAGHTASDRVETLLHNLFRGTGLAGVAGFPKLRPLGEELVLARPLIECSRADVEAYLRVLSQPFRHDSTNDDSAYRRNFLRNELLPLVRNHYGVGVDQRLVAFSQLAEQAAQTLQDLARKYLDDVNQMRAPATLKNAIAIPGFSLFPALWPIVREALHHQWRALGWPLQKMSRNHWEAIRVALESPQSPNSFPGNLRMRQVSGWVVVEPTASESAASSD